MTRARDLANIADGTFTATDLDLSGTLTVSGDATFDTNTLFVDVSANAVGIGTTSPSSELHVKSSGTSSDTLTIENSTGNGSWRVKEGGSSNALLQGYNASNSETIRLDPTSDTFFNGGNVGIGTSSPDYNFHVTGTGDTIAAITAGATSIAGLNLGNSTNKADGGIRYDNSADALIFRASNAERMRIDSSGNVGIGTSAPGRKFTLILNDTTAYNSASFESSSLGNYVRNTDTTIGSYVGMHFAVGNNSDAAIAAVRNADGEATLTFGTRGAGSGAIIERARIDSSGVLFSGKSTQDISIVGHELHPQGFVFHTRDNAEVLYLRRNSSDGRIQNFYKDGTLVGGIGVSGGNNLYISGEAASHSGLTFATGEILPTAVGVITDGAESLGSSSNRFKDIYRSGSTISTSDRNAKQDERPLTEAEASVAQACKGLLKAFRFIDAVEKDGDGARIHFGIIAQDLQAAFEAEGLDANRYAMFRPSTFTDDEGNEQTRLGVCYENLLAFIIAAL